MKSLSTVRLPLTLLHPSSESPFHSFTLFHCSSCSLCPSAASVSPFLPSLSPSRIDDIWTRWNRACHCSCLRLPEMMQRNDNRVSRRNHTLPIYNLIQLSSLSDTQNLLCDAHTHTARQTKQLTPLTHIHPLRQIGKLPSNFICLLLLPSFSLCVFLFHSSFSLSVFAPSLSLSACIAVLGATLYHSNMKTSLRSCTQSN